MSWLKRVKNYWVYVKSKCQYGEESYICCGLPMLLIDYFLNYIS